MYQQVQSLLDSPTRRRSLAARLEAERNAKNNGTIPGGLASMIDAGTAAYLNIKDQGDQSRAFDALSKGMMEETQINTADGMQPNAPRIAPGLAGARERLGALPDNEYAGRLSQMLAFQDLEAKQRAAELQAQQGFQLTRDEANNRARMAAAAAGRSSVNVNMPSGAPEVGKIPPGYQMVYDPVNRTYNMQPIPGGPVAVDIASAEEKKVNKNEGEAVKTGLVLEDIGRFRDKIKNAPWYSPVTGLGGAILANLPSSGAYNTARIADSIRANIGFDRLQKMRDESPTGGALGAVNNQEMQLLQSVLGSLDQAQTEDQLLFNLERLEGIYRGMARKLAAYPNAAQYGFGDGGDIGSGVTTVPPQDTGPVDYIFNPATGKVERPR